MSQRPHSERGRERGGRRRVTTVFFLRLQAGQRSISFFFIGGVIMRLERVDMHAAGLP